LRLGLAFAVSTDQHPEKVADGQQSEAIGAATRQRRVSRVWKLEYPKTNIQNMKNIPFQVEIFTSKNKY